MFYKANIVDLERIMYLSLQVLVPMYQLPGPAKKVKSKLRFAVVGRYLIYVVGPHQMITATDSMN